MCYLALGHDEIAIVDITFFAELRTGQLRGPSEELVADKVEFG